MLHLCILVNGFPNDISEVLPLETHAEDIFLPEFQSLLNIVHNLGCRSGGKSQDRSSRFQPAYFGNSEVRWAEVISPLADAVRFVNGDEADIYVSQLGEEDVGRQSLGRYVQQFGMAENAVLKRRYYLVS